ncbi:MAG: hypothetical protein DMG09_17045 [Acidobacteria bacterium]|nr:MAG: hypothetical protein DMG09_17045 [Acidobacteriota bacterium]
MAKGAHQEFGIGAGTRSRAAPHYRSDRREACGHAWRTGILSRTSCSTRSAKRTALFWWHEGQNAPLAQNPRGGPAGATGPVGEGAVTASQNFDCLPTSLRDRNAYTSLYVIREACGERDIKAIPQGLVHVRFLESQGRLYFATHIGY